MTSTYAPETSTGLTRIDPEKHKFQPLRALQALGRLFKNKEDTEQVFIIMRSLSGKSVPRGYAKLLATPEGGEIAYRREELAHILSDHEFLKTLPEGSVGRAYLKFVTSENISAYGLVEESRKGVEDDIDRKHPLAWYGRRMRDVHDLWHILSGYGRDALGEACLVGFSYAQTRSLGFGFIAFFGALKIKKEAPNLPILKAVWQGYQNGRKAAWLPAVDYIRLLAEPLDAARTRLKIEKPSVYLSVPSDTREGALKVQAA